MVRVFFLLTVSILKFSNVLDFSKKKKVVRSRGQYLADGVNAFVASVLLSLCVECVVSPWGRLQTEEEER